MSTGILECGNYPSLQYLKFANTSGCQSDSYFIGATRSISYLASSFGSAKEQEGILWHWNSPEYTDLENYSTQNPPLFGYVQPQTLSAEINSSSSQNPTRIDQKCLSTYSRYNLVQNKRIQTVPDQESVGRYNKLIKDYHQDILSENINELTNQVVKWREYGWWPYLMTPLSLSFWIGGCGEPCYVCSYADHLCGGGAEHALNLVIYSLDQYWITEKADKGHLWPSDRFLLDYYGTITRGPEPTIGWQSYLLAKKETCSYCGCIIFCILVACIDPWFIRYSAVSSIITFNDLDGIPQKLPGKFIEYAEFIKKQLNGDDIEKKSILFDHMPQERLFIDGQVDYYTADIFNKGGIDKPPSGYLLGSELNPLLPGAKILGQDYTYIEDGKKFAFATITDSSGFHYEEKNINGTDCTEEDKKNENCQLELKDSIFSGFRTRGSINDKGYLIRNVATKYYDHKIRKDIFKYNWLYVDIPNPIRTSVTPAVSSFDSFDIPDLYFQDTNLLTIMRKNVYFKTILKSGDIILNGNNSTRLRIDTYFELFSSISQDDRYYPFLWVDRIEKKIIKTPYNLYFKSGENKFKECLLGETLYELEPGRYYFPNPYACAARPKTSPYDGNIHGGKIGIDYWVEDFDNHNKYFSTNLPMQFLGVTGENANIISGKKEKDYIKMLHSAKIILGNPESGNYAITSVNEENFYTSGPIEEFPNLIFAQDEDNEIIDWGDTSLAWYKNGKFDRLRMLEDQKGLFTADLRNYDKKWWSGYIV